MHHNLITNLTERLYIMTTSTTTATVLIELTREQATFLVEAMNWWQTSGVNVWSARDAKDISESTMKALLV